MKASFKIVFFIICLNLASGLVLELTTPMSSYMVTKKGWSTQVENNTLWIQHHNYTEFVENMSRLKVPDVSAQSPMWLQTLQVVWLVFKTISYVVVGFPALLLSMGIAPPIAVAIGIIVSFFVIMWIIEVGTGRTVIGD